MREFACLEISRLAPSPPAAQVDPVVYRCGECELDATNRSFKRDNVLQALEPKAFAVLIQLVSRPRELVTREHLLDEVWGHRHVTCSTLNRVIGLARRALADDADAPNFIHTVHGAGYRYVGPVERVTAIVEAHACFAPPAAQRLPAPLAELIGRKAELKQIEELLDAGRSLTILGPGGVGKTQCALAFAHSHKHAYPDGIWFFDLAPFQRVDDWLKALASSMGIAPATERDPLPAITDSLKDRRALLFLDNCDRLALQLGR
jgi:DNA-binding winged helix-turn-helix (wHTH) protein